MRFCFFLPYKNQKGGYTTLLITLIKALEQRGQKTLLVNYHDGLIARELLKDGIQPQIVEVDQLKESADTKIFSPDDIFVTSFFNEALYTLMKANPRVLYYDINDFIGNISDYRFGIKLRPLSKRLVLKLLQKDAIVFMDDTGPFNARKYLGVTIDKPQYLPVPVDAESHQQHDSVCRLKDGDAIHVTYIGRSVRWKLTVLKKIIEDMLRVQQSICLHILVDDLKSFHTILSVESYRNQNIGFHFYENLDPSEITDFLRKNSDVHFGMGTTALHAAELAIPAVLVDYSEDDFPENYSYNWLYSAENFSLGKNLQKRGFSKGMAMQQLLKAVGDKNERDEISRRTYEYFSLHHRSDAVVRKLVEYAEKSTFRIRDARWLIPYYYKSHQTIKWIWQRTKSKRQ